jgi:hypothetical protein
MPQRCERQPRDECRQHMMLVPVEMRHRNGQSRIVTCARTAQRQQRNGAAWNRA